jgi:hypothetical protein
MSYLRKVFIQKTTLGKDSTLGKVFVQKINPYAHPLILHQIEEEKKEDTYLIV